MGFSFNVGGLFGFMFFIMFAAIAGFILYTIIHKISEEAKNSQAPVQKISARIVSKRTEVSGTSGSMNADGMMTGGTTSTSHYVTFEAPDGSRLELKVKGSEFGMLAEGDCGELTFQRKRYLGFDRMQTPEQMLYAQQVQEQQLLNQVMQEQMMYGQPMPEQIPPDQFIQTENEQQRMQF
ncbi:MAG: DUF2500 domain-containing protein [Oscillospiraceae bacterium]|nr:DUF2500 domain-containing protein [Oscillospiraceae bacterium]